MIFLPNLSVSMPATGRPSSDAMRSWMRSPEQASRFRNQAMRLRHQAVPSPGESQEVVKLHQQR